MTAKAASFDLQPQRFDGLATTTSHDFDLDLGTPPYTDSMVRVQAEVYLGQWSSGLAKACALGAEAVATNKASTVAMLTAKAASSNPINSNTAGFFNTSRVQATDTSFDQSTAVFTISGNNLRLTVLNQGSVGGVTADILVIFKITIAGSSA